MINSLYDNFKHWSEKGSVYIISDPHFNDSDCKYMDPNWTEAEEYLAKINKKVFKNDTLICLGDCGQLDYTLFAGDKDVRVEFDNDDVKLSLYVDGLMGKKAEAIRKIFPDKVMMGNVALTIDVIPADKEPSYEDLVKVAFYGNENFVGVDSQDHGIYGSTSYGLFKNVTAQFYSDDLTQYDGMNTVVIADIAREILTSDNKFYFSTEV